MEAAKKAARKSAETRLPNPGSLSGDGMTPLLPREGKADIERLAYELTREASAFAGQVPLENQLMLAELVRSMNCYYSNLIEGHHTHPRDIDTAMTRDYSLEPEKRNLQLEATAHIHLQGCIDEGRTPDYEPAGAEFARWLHREFCAHLPEDLLVVKNPETGERKKVFPGAFRDGGVAVGGHVPPRAEELANYLRRFEETYGSKKLPGTQYIAAMGAAHHRFAWIHPFYDGNGRVMRLMCHTMLLRYGLGSGMWSIARGLARSQNRYKGLLASADRRRDKDYDGCGVLSASGLEAFCAYFLETAIDQVRFMAKLLQPAGLLKRIEAWCVAKVAAKRLEKGSFSVLREAWLVGPVERARVMDIANVKERQAREIVSRLVAMRVLRSESTRGPLRLVCPIDALEAWLPGLYPPIASLPETGIGVGPAWI